MKALAKFLAVFKPKKSSSQDWILHRDDAQSKLPPQSGSSNGCKGVKTIRQLPYLPNIAPEDFFFIPENKIGMGGPLVVPGSSKPSLKMSSPVPLGRGWTPAKSMSKIGCD
jgi:hypothetical protein